MPAHGLIARPDGVSLLCPHVSLLYCNTVGGNPYALILSCSLPGTAGPGYSQWTALSDPEGLPALGFSDIPTPLAGWIMHASVCRILVLACGDLLLPETAAPNAGPLYLNTVEQALESIWPPIARAVADKPSLLLDARAPPPQHHSAVARRRSISGPIQVLCSHPPVHNGPDRDRTGDLPGRSPLQGPHDAG